MKKHKPYSLRTQTLALLVLLFLTFTGLIYYNNRSSYSILLERIYDNTADTVIQYEKALDEEFSRMDSSLSSMAAGNANLDALRSGTSEEILWHLSLYRLQKQYTTALASSSADAFFCYLPGESYYLISSRENLTHMRAKAVIQNLVENEALTWTLIPSGGEYYIGRCLRDRELYTGALIHLSSLLKRLPEEGYDFLTAEGVLLISGSRYETLAGTDAPLSTGYQITGGSPREKTLIVYTPLQKADLRLCKVIPYAQVTDNGKAMRISLLTVSIVAVAAFILVSVFLNRSVLKPLKLLTRRIRSLKDGRLDIYLPRSPQPEEFYDVFTMFNETVSELKNLEIDIYERKLKTQELELQYAKQQVTPHFLINCLNTAYQLTEIDRMDLARQMLRSLSNHLRYTLSSGQTVRLGDELEFVRNYMAISEIRYPHEIVLQISCSPVFSDATVVPLLLLNFVENSVKYQTVHGKILRIFISVEEVQEEDGPKLHIMIYDTGKGYSPEAMEYLKSIDTEPMLHSEHIGIANVMIRMKHIFPTARFVFSNRENAGAQADIYFPFSGREGAIG